MAKNKIPWDDDDVPELTDEFFAKAEPGHVFLPKHFGAEVADALIYKKFGRPAAADPKIQATVRFNASLLRAFKATGKGWQTRMNTALMEWATQHNML